MFTGPRRSSSLLQNNERAAERSQTPQKKEGSRRKAGSERRTASDSVAINHREREEEEESKEAAHDGRSVCVDSGCERHGGFCLGSEPQVSESRAALNSVYSHSGRNANLNANLFVVEAKNKVIVSIFSPFTLIFTGQYSINRLQRTATLFNFAFSLRNKKKNRNYQYYHDKILEKANKSEL